MNERGNTLAAERGGIVTGWIFRLIVILAVSGLALYEAGAVIVARVTVDQVASEAAREAGSVYGTTDSRSRARREAERIAARSGATVTDMRIPRAREVLYVTVEKDAPTVLIHRIGFLEKWKTASSEHKGTIT